MLKTPLQLCAPDNAFDKANAFLMLKTTSFTEERRLQNLRGFPIDLSLLCHSVPSTQDTPTQKCFSSSCRLVTVEKSHFQKLRLGFFASKTDTNNLTTG